MNKVCAGRTRKGERAAGYGCEEERRTGGASSVDVDDAKAPCRRQRLTCEDGRSPLFFLTVTNDALAEHGVGSCFTAKGGDVVNLPAPPLRASSVVEFRELE